MPGRVSEQWLTEMPRVLGQRSVCPMCTGGIFRQAERGGTDRIFRLVGLLPVRCVNCWRRYYRWGGVTTEE